MANKINYKNLMDGQIKELKNKESKAKLLLHSCCAPCSTAVLEVLLPYFDITIYYYNPNTYPEKEYNERLDELKIYIKTRYLEEHITIIESNYDSNEFYTIAKGLELEPEGGKRCLECYRLRLEHTADVAIENNMDYFTTVLSISPHKNVKWINEIGMDIAEKKGIIFLNGDFKKSNGFKRSTELSKEYDLYRQDYCGCVYSLKESKLRNENNK